MEWKSSVAEIDAAFNGMEARLRKQGAVLHMALDGNQTDLPSNSNIILLGSWVYKHCDRTATVDNFMRAAVALSDSLDWDKKLMVKTTAVRDSLGDISGSSAAENEQAASDSILHEQIVRVIERARRVSKDYIPFTNRVGPDYLKQQASLESLEKEFARLMKPYAKVRPTMAQAVAIFTAITEFRAAAQQQSHDERLDQV